MFTLNPLAPASIPRKMTIAEPHREVAGEVKTENPTRLVTSKLSASAEPFTPNPQRLHQIITSLPPSHSINSATTSTETSPHPSTPDTQVIPSYSYPRSTSGRHLCPPILIPPTSPSSSPALLPRPQSEEEEAAETFSPTSSHCPSPTTTTLPTPGRMRGGAKPFVPGIRWFTDPPIRIIIDGEPRSLLSHIVDTETTLLPPLLGTTVPHLTPNISIPSPRDSRERKPTRKNIRFPRAAQYPYITIPSPSPSHSSSSTSNFTMSSPPLLQQAIRVDTPPTLSDLRKNRNLKVWRSIYIPYSPPKIHYPSSTASSQTPTTINSPLFPDEVNPIIINIDNPTHDFAYEYEFQSSHTAEMLRWVNSSILERYGLLEIDYPRFHRSFYPNSPISSPVSPSHGYKVKVEEVEVPDEKYTIDRDIWSKWQLFQPLEPTRSEDGTKPRRLPGGKVLISDVWWRRRIIRLRNREESSREVIGREVKRIVSNGTIIERRIVSDGQKPNNGKIEESREREQEEVKEFRAFVDVPEKYIW